MTNKLLDEEMELLADIDVDDMMKDEIERREREIYANIKYESYLDHMTNYFLNTSSPLSPVNENQIGTASPLTGSINNNVDLTSDPSIVNLDHAADEISDIVTDSVVGSQSSDVSIFSIN